MNLSILKIALPKYDGYLPKYSLLLNTSLAISMSETTTIGWLPIHSVNTEPYFLTKDLITSLQ